MAHRHRAYAGLVNATAADALGFLNRDDHRQIRRFSDQHIEGTPSARLASEP